MKRRAIPVAALAAALLAPLAAQAPKTEGVAAAFYEGDAVQLQMTGAPKRHPALQLGPWHFGERSSAGSMTDKHPNLYIVCPGTQYASRAEPQWDHNLVINTVPTSDAPVQWDVIWAAVIDPTLQADFRDERELLLAAQQTFLPNDLFDLSDVPGRALLREYFDVRTYRDLAGLERDGRLPRVIVQPAGFSVRAATVQSGQAGAPAAAETRP